MTGRYWGEFAELADEGATMVEPFNGPVARLYDQMSMPDWDEQGYIALAARKGGPILELGCGTGRILLKLAAAGHMVTGLDLSPDMLAIVRAKIEGLPTVERSRIEIVQADAADFELDGRFALILLPYLTLGLIDGDDHPALLRCVHRHLCSDGEFAFDYLTISDAASAGLDGTVLDRIFDVDGLIVPARFGVRYDPALRSLVVNASWQIRASAGTGPMLESMAIRVFDHAEVGALIDAAGLVTIERVTAEMGDEATRRTTVRCRKRSSHPHPLWHPYSPRAAVETGGMTLVAGRGCEVVDDRGKRYIDASGGLWSVNCGYGVPEIADAVAEQLRRLSHGTLFLGGSNLPAVDLARELVELAPGALEWVYLTGSGSESVELALKLARSFFALKGQPERQGILFLDNSYHGTFFGSIAVSGLVPESAIFGPLPRGFGPVPAPNGTGESAALSAAAIEAMLDHCASRVAALIIEPVIASAGIVVPPQDWFDRVKRACASHGVLLIVDEVATGFGRTGRWFACEHFGLQPDILLVGKGLNNGALPLGAALFSAEIGETLDKSPTGIVHGSTHNGNPACCAAALATIAAIRRDGLLERAARAGEALVRRLRSLAGAPGLGEVRGIGLMVYAGLVDEAGIPANQGQVLAVLARMRGRGVIAYPADDGIILCPPLIIDDREIDLVVASLADSLAGCRLVDGRLAAGQPGP